MFYLIDFGHLTDETGYIVVPEKTYSKLCSKAKSSSGKRTVQILLRDYEYDVDDLVAALENAKVITDMEFVAFRSMFGDDCVGTASVSKLIESL